MYRLMSTAQALLLAGGMAPAKAKKRLWRGDYKLRELLMMTGEGRGRLPVLEWDPWEEDAEPVPERVEPARIPRLIGGGKMTVASKTAAR